ncbi:MAG: helix-hairpin-helix domain-containing protein [Methanosarcinaceae archaeon]|nr:helix-hairpin-helix domain-containing protein [Methanosarcinaceae archaeon]
MSKPDRSKLKDLQQIPGVGRKISEDLWDMGFHSVRDLKDQDPEELYLRLCAQKGMHIDRCILYVFRCAVYYASNTEYDSELLKWWNWKEDGE